MVISGTTEKRKSIALVQNSSCPAIYALGILALGRGDGWVIFALQKNAAQNFKK